MYLVFCRLFFTFSSPLPPRHQRSIWALPGISLLHRRCVLERFRETQKEDDCRPLSIQFSLPCSHSLVGKRNYTNPSWNFIFSMISIIFPLPIFYMVFLKPDMYSKNQKIMLQSPFTNHLSQPCEKTTMFYGLLFNI